MQELNDELSFLANFLNEGIYFINDEIETTSKVEESSVQLVVEDKMPLVESNIDFFGKNNKQLCILVDYDNDEWIMPKDKMVLQKILVAVDHSFDDVSLINVNRIPDHNLENITNAIPCKRVICFGINENLAGDYEKDKVIDTVGCKLLFCSDSLTTIAMSKQKKTVLWNNLKEMFGK